MPGLLGKLRCHRCGQLTANPHFIDDRPYGKGCYQVVLKMRENNKAKVKYLKKIIDSTKVSK